MDKRKTVSLLKIAAAVLCAAAIIFVAVFLVGKTVFKVVYPMKYTDEIARYAAEYKVPESLLYAVVHTESGYDPNAKSGAGALGLTQITPETFSWLQTKTGEELPESELYNPEVSIKYCAVFYGLLLTEFGDTKTAVAAYHAGRGRVNSWLSDSEISPDGQTLENIPAGETKNYVAKVLRAITIYNNLYKKELTDHV